jgi:hypothetical protein
MIRLPDESSAVPERSPGEPVGPALSASNVGRPEERPLRCTCVAGPSLRITKSQHELATRSRVRGELQFVGVQGGRQKAH